MTPEIKICGLKDGAMLAAAANAGATMAGFVFYPRSPRAVDLEAAAELATVTPPSCARWPWWSTLTTRSFAISLTP